MRYAAVLLVLTSAAHADTDRPAVDQALAKSVATDFTHCGEHPRAVFDWTSYDAIDWQKAGKNPREYLASVRSTVASLGAGLDKLCGDADYRAVLGSIATIVYKVTDDKSVHLAAAISGTTLTFTDYTFGSTRVIDDFEQAAQRACELASVAPVADKRSPPAAPAKAPPASSAWDGRYEASPAAGMGGLCPRPDHTGTLTVSGGRFSFPWFIDDWTGERGATVKVGRVDGVVHANGSTTTTATFAEPVLRSTQVRTVKLKRQLDAIKQLPLAFSRRGAQKVVKVSSGDCRLAWETPEPKPKTTSAPPRETRPPSKPAPPDDSVQRAHEETERSARRARCRDSCDTKHEQCRENRCDAPKDACKSRCEDISDSSERSDCTRRCSEPLMNCRLGCDDERDTCKSDCANL